jgi:hypothetical protein
MSYRQQRTFRQHTHDAPEPRKAKPITPGQIQPGKLGVYKGKNLVAQCGPRATSATCRRFGVMDAKPGKKNGAPAWCGK